MAYEGLAGIERMAREPVTPSVTWQDAREADYQLYLSWGWSPMEATWAAYYGKPFSCHVTVS